MGSIATELVGASGINSTTLVAQITPLVPVIVMIALFAFGWAKLSGLAKGASKGKLKLK
jgi:hypothetical protein